MHVRARLDCVGIIVFIAGLFGASCATRKGDVLTKEGATLPARQTATSTVTAPTASTRATVEATYGKLPLHFEANRGQSDDQVKFLARGSGYTLFLTAAEVVIALQQSAVSGQPSAAETQSPPVLRMQLVGANPRSHVAGLDELPGKSNYFFGSDPTQWHTNIPTYARVKYQNVYPGIDLVYYGNQQQLEYDFVVAPGADPAAIRLAFDGLGGAGFKPAPTIDDATGDLVLNTAGGELRFHQPRLYQEIDGNRRPIAGRYILFDSESGDTGLRTQQVGFEVAAYDTSKPLVIDPVLVYSTYLGGIYRDEGNAIAADANGNVYVTGRAQSPDFPTTNPVQSVYGGDPADVFITKLNPTGSALVYSTYLGGTSEDIGVSIAVDALGNTYVTGHAGSPNFPTTAKPFPPTGYTGEIFPCSVFVLKLDPTGSTLSYAICLPIINTSAHSIAIDTSGNAYVTGQTFSPNFPTTSEAFQPSCHLQDPNIHNVSCDDAFVIKLNPTGSIPLYSTYLGGNDGDRGSAIAVDAAGSAYVTGNAGSDFPTTTGAFQPTCNRGSVDNCADAFGAKLNPAGSALIYSTYLGGSDFDVPSGIAVDVSGNAYVTGFTRSPDFPTTAGVFQPTCQPNNFGNCFDAFVSKLNPTGSALVYSSYLGGSDGTNRNAIAVDASGNAYVASSLLSFSTDPVCRGGFGLPVPCPISTPFVTKLNAAGTAVIYSISLSGSSDLHFDSALDIAVDAFGNAYVTGSTSSADFPITEGAFQNTLRGFSDAFIAKIADRPAGIVANFESPENGPVSGIFVIRGWAFATEAEVAISSVELFIDGQSAGEIPCCSPRGDVQAAFPQFPADNTFNSGWGTVFNWGIASAGTHTLRLFIRNTAGELFVTDTRIVTVVKPGDAEFLDQFDLSQATVSIQGNDLVVDSILVRDKTSQQQKRINTRFRWQSSTQSFGMVEAQTVEILALSRSLFSSLLALLSPRLLDWQAIANAQTLPIIQASFESPEEEQVVSGIGVIRGWTFDEARATLPPLRLFIDGQVGPLVPCCSTRADVAAAFPAIPHALNSGWGTVFNYNLLSAGNHTIQVGLGYFGSSIFLPQHKVTVVKPGGFEFLDQFDLSQATARIEGGNIILSGVVVRDEGRTSQQTKTVEVRLHWFESAQGLGIVAASSS